MHREIFHFAMVYQFYIFNGNWQMATVFFLYHSLCNSARRLSRIDRQSLFFIPWFLVLLPTPPTPCKHYMNGLLHCFPTLLERRFDVLTRNSLSSFGLAQGWSLFRLTTDGIECVALLPGSAMPGEVEKACNSLDCAIICYLWCSLQRPYLYFSVIDFLLRSQLIQSSLWSRSVFSRIGSATFEHLLPMFNTAHWSVK